MVCVDTFHFKNVGFVAAITIIISFNAFGVIMAQSNALALSTGMSLN